MGICNRLRLGNIRDWYGSSRSPRYDRTASYYILHKPRSLQQVDQVAVYLFSSVAFVREVMVPRFLVAGYRIVAGMVRDIVQISFANTDHQPVEGWEPVEYLS